MSEKTLKPKYISFKDKLKFSSHPVKDSLKLNHIDTYNAFKVYYANSYDSFIQCTFVTNRCISIEFGSSYKVYRNQGYFSLQIKDQANTLINRKEFVCELRLHIRAMISGEFEEPKIDDIL